MLIALQTPEEKLQAAKDMSGTGSIHSMILQVLSE